MFTIIKTLLQGDTIVLPRTKSSAVHMEDGTTVEYAIKNVSTDYVKLSSEVATALGLVEGASLSTVLIDNQTRNNNNVLAAAEVI